MSSGQICLIADAPAFDRPSSRRLYTAAAFGHNRRVFVLGTLPPGTLHGSRLGARCLRWDHRGGRGLRCRLSGERRLRALGAGAVHHRSRLAVCKSWLHARMPALLALAVTMTVTVAVCLALPRWSHGALAASALRCSPTPRAIRRFTTGDRLARRSWNFGRGLMERALQRRLARPLGGPDHRPRQHDFELLADRPCLRHLGTDGSRGPALARIDLLQHGNLSILLQGDSGYGRENPQVHGGADADEHRDRRSRRRLRLDRRTALRS